MTATHGACYRRSAQTCRLASQPMRGSPASSAAITVPVWLGVRSSGRRPLCAAAATGYGGTPPPGRRGPTGCRFIKSMSMSAHGRSRPNCVCRCRNGFAKFGQAADPHLGGRERVHPEDQSCAGGRGCWPANTSARTSSGRVRIGWWTTMGSGKPTGAVEFGHDFLRVGGNLTCRKAASPYRC